MKKRIVALLLALILTVGLLPVSALAKDATEAPAAPQASDTEYITDVNTGGGEENPVDSELPVAQDADPNAAAHPDFNDLNNKITVVCKTDNALHAAQSAKYDLLAESYTDNGTQVTASGTTYSITLDKEKYAIQFSKKPAGISHTVSAPAGDITIVWNWDTDSGKWILDESSVNKAVIEVTCQNTPAAGNLARVYVYIQTFHRSATRTDAITVDEAAQKRLGFGYSTKPGAYLGDSRNQTWFTLGQFDSAVVPLLYNADKYAKVQDSKVVSLIAAEMGTNYEKLSKYTGKSDVAPTTCTNDTIGKIKWSTIAWQYNTLDLYDGTNDPGGQGADMNGNSRNRSWHFDGILYFYKVEFKPGADDDSVTGLPSNGYFLDGEQISDIPSRSGYKFAGWKASTDGTDGSIHQAPYTVTSDVTLTAQWTPATEIGDIMDLYALYDVQHIKQQPDGEYDVAGAEIEHRYAKLGTSVSATPKDYGSHYSVNAEKSTMTGTAIKPTLEGEKAVYTVLQVYYDLDFHTLTFDPNGGSAVSPDAITVRHGTRVTDGPLLPPFRAGYNFTGWYEDLACTTPFGFDIVLTEDKTVYAGWTPASPIVPTVPVLPVKPQPTKPALNKDDHYAYVIGYPDGTVHPNGSITRAEATTIFFRLLTDASREQYWATTNPYSDVNAGSWYNNAISTLSNAGIVDGYPDGTFRPDAPITRAEMAKLITAFARLSKSESRFNDIAGHWAETSIKLAAGNGWIEGYPDGSFRPQQDITRAETVTMVNRVLERVPAYESRLLSHDRMLTFPDCQPGQWFYIAMQEATNSHNYERAVTETKGDEQWLALRANRDWCLLER